MSKHYVGEVGTDIILNAGSDISSATSVKVGYVKPDGTTGTWDGAVYNTNYIKYTTIAESFNIPGVWRLQAVVVSPLWEGRGESVEIMVYPAGEGIISGDLASLYDLKDFLAITQTNIDDDVLLQKLLARKSKDIENECQRTFTAADFTEYYRGDGTSKLQVNNYPINSVTHIYDDTDRVWGSDTEIDSAEISISDEVEGIIILEDDIFSESSDIENIKIIYNAGYSTIPIDLQSACIRLCAADYLESKGLAKGIEEGENNPGRLRKEARRIVNRYKRIR